ncbi:MAG: hypothetical protein AAGD01_11015 [Acidobacteriota bacterium]
MKLRLSLTAVAIALSALTFFASPALAQDQESSRAGVVVDFGDGKVEQDCVSFSSSDYNGEELLQDAGFELDTMSDANGTNICSIDELGCDFPNQKCFCSCEGSGTCTYWVYWILTQNPEDGTWEWKSSDLLANNQEVTNNDVNGWSWGAANKPPVVTIDQVCAGS